MNVKEYINKLEDIRNSIQDEVERIVYANENKIIRLNTQQIEEHIGFDGKPLENSNRIYSGSYRTSFFNALGDYRQAGQPYTFLDTGDFYKGFYIDLDSTLTKLEINSTGTGAGDKAQFFRGYYNIFGLTQQNQNTLNYEIILQEIQKFIKQKIG